MPGRRLVIALWAALVLVIALTLTPWAVGSFLGDDYASELRVHIHRDPSTVWASVLDYERNPINSSAVLRVVNLESEDGLPAWEEEMSQNSATVQTVELLEGRRVVREMVSFDGLMQTRWELELSEVDGGCELRLHQEVHVSATGMIGAHLRFVLRFMNNVETGPRLYLERLSQELDAQGGGQ